ncbi:DsrE family protein [Sphingobium chungangianum]
MRELRIVVATADAERLRGALVLASAQAALGGAASIFLQLDAVALLRRPITAPADAAHAATGLPPLEVLISEALAFGVNILACQSGLTLANMTADMLPAEAQVGGPVSFLQETSDEARLLFA